METPLGRGYAIMVDRSAHDYYWTVALDNQALVTFTQDRVRICRSYTHRRGLPDEEMRRIVMPWTAKDAIHSTKKAKSKGAKKQWRAVANKVLKETGDDAKAKMIANGVIKKRGR
jgi:hypothetical protein